MNIALKYILSCITATFSNLATQVLFILNEFFNCNDVVDLTNCYILKYTLGKHFIFDINLLRNIA